jgi:hypothetical protein
MAITLGTSSLGTAASTTSATTLVITTGAAATVGQFIVVHVAADNASATTPTFTAADSAGNTYTTRVQGAVNASANAGVAGAIITAPVTSELASGGTITITLSTAVVNKAARAVAFNGVGALRAIGTTNAGESTAATVTTTGSALTGDLVLGAAAIESRTTPSAYDTDTVNGSWSTGRALISGGAGPEASKVLIADQHKIVTGDGTQTYNLTNASTDWVALICAFEAAAEGDAVAVNLEGTASLAGTLTGQGAVQYGLAQPAIYHIDATSGDDDNDGLTPATAWQTIAKVNASSFVAGDQILFKRGEIWRERLAFYGSGSSGSPITIGAYGTGDRPLITGGDSITGWTQETTYYYASGYASNPLVVVDSNNVPYPSVATKGEVAAGNRWYDSANQRIYVYNTGSAPSGFAASVRDEVINLWANEHITIRDLKLTVGGRYGIKGAGECVSFVVDDVVVEACWGAGIVFEGGASITVRDCTVNYANAGGTSSWHESITFEGVNGFEATGNTVTNGGKEGIDAKYNSRNGVINNNICYGNNGPQIYIDAANNIEIAYNRVHSSNVGKPALALAVEELYNPNEYNLHTISVHHNLIYNSGAGIMVLIEDSEAFADIYNVKIDNNTIYNNNKNNWGGIFFLGTGNAGNFGTGNTIRNNILYDNTQLGGSRAIRDDMTVVGQFTVSHNLFGTDEPSHTFGSNSVIGNPQFTDAANGDFTLQSNSPCIDAGTDVGLTTDFAGNPIVGDPDIGAFESATAFPLTLSGSAALTGTTASAGALEIDAPVSLAGSAALTGALTGAGGVSFPLTLSGSAVLVGSVEGSGTLAVEEPLPVDLDGSAVLVGALTGAGALYHGFGLSGSAALSGDLAASGAIEFPLELAGTAALAGTLTGAGTTEFPLELSGSVALNGSIAGSGELVIQEPVPIDLDGAGVLIGALAGAGTIEFPLGLSGTASLDGTLTGAGSITFPLELAGSGVLVGGLTGSGILSAGVAVELSGTAALGGTLLGAGSLLGDLRWDGQGRTWDEVGATWDGIDFFLSGAAVLSGELNASGVLGDWAGLPLFVGSNRVTSVYWGGRTLAAIWYQGQQVWP